MARRDETVYHLRAEDKTSAAFRSARKGVSGLEMAAKRAIAPVAALAAAGAALNKITNVTREFDKLNAQLITATGSADKAAKAFDAIQDFAATTPFDLAQATGAFNKLVNMGLTPSERALRSYGDTASAMGKSLDQMIEAVADAATGEFERLKEFGIKASSQGDEVAFTFRGVTTTVKKNAEEIEGYLMALGETNFGGAMKRQMDTLDGAISNIGDSWDMLWLTISQDSPIGNAIEGTVRIGISALNALENKIKALSGEEVRDLQTLVEDLDRMSARTVTGRGSGQFNRDLNATKASLAAYSEAEIQMARLQNQLEGMTESQEELNASISRGRGESLESYKLRKSQTDEAIAGLEAQKAAITAQIEELQKVPEVAAAAQDALAPYKIVGSGPETPEGEGPVKLIDFPTADEADAAIANLNRVGDALVDVRERGVDGVTDGFKNLIGSTLTLEDRLVNVANAFLNIGIDVIGIVVKEWIAGQLAMAAAEKVRAATSIGTNAAVSAASMISAGSLAKAWGAAAWAASVATGGVATAAGTAAFMSGLAASTAATIAASAVSTAANIGFSALGGASGARATGGPVSAGQTVLVGEHGPELWEPKSSGYITPNHRMGGSDSVTQNVTLNINGRLTSAEIEETKRGAAEVALNLLPARMSRGGNYRRTVLA